MNGRKSETRIDTETGEILYPSLYNAETGEYEGQLYLPQKTKFRIPLQHKLDKKTLNELIRLDKTKIETIVSALILLLAVIVFYPILAIVVCVFEIILHNWAHKKNKTLKDDTFYYRSPLHCIVKEFCARCKDVSATEKIWKLQDKRNDRMKKYGLESIRRVVT